MKTLYCFLSYKRPKVLAECIRTAYEYSHVKPTLSYILDDNSGAEHQQSLVNFAQEYSKSLGPINLVLNSENLGVGHQLELAFSLAFQHDVDLFFLCEGDYIFRNEFLLDIYDAFEQCPNSLAITSAHHADMTKPEKYYYEFADIMKAYFSRDIENRFDYYKQFTVNTSRGPMDILPCTNSCGAQTIHMKRLKDFIFKDLGAEKEFKESLYKSFQENGNRRTASDGRISSTITYFHTEWLKKNKLDLSKNFSYLTPLPSISVHLCNGGLNSPQNKYLFPEGSDFPGVNAGTFPIDYNNWKRSKI